MDDYLLYDFPSVSSNERFNKALPVIKENKGKFIVGKMFATLFERMHFLRGMYKLFMDLYLNESKVRIST